MVKTETREGVTKSFASGTGMVESDDDDDLPLALLKKPSDDDEDVPLAELGGDGASYPRNDDDDRGQDQLPFSVRPNKPRPVSRSPLPEHPKTPVTTVEDQDIGVMDSKPPAKNASMQDVTTRASTGIIRRGGKTEPERQSSTTDEEVEPKQYSLRSSAYLQNLAEMHFGFSTIVVGESAAITFHSFNRNRGMT